MWLYKWKEDIYWKFIFFEENIKDIKSELVCKKCKSIFSSFDSKNSNNICTNCYPKGNKDEKFNNFQTRSILNNLKYLIYFAIDENEQANIKEDKNNNSDSAEKKEKLKKSQVLKDLITTTIINYIIYPNYNLYLTIKNLFETFSDYCETPDNPDNKYYFKKIIEINRNKKKLINLNSSLNNFVIKVDVRQLKFYEDLIEKYIVKKFKNLIELNLWENCIYSIKPLLNAEWLNLKYLVLCFNKLSDENIIFIENLNAKELISLDLEFNNFTKYELLIAIGNNKHGRFKKLEELKIEYNDFKIIEKKNKKKENRKSLEEIVDELKKLDFSSIRILSANNGSLPQKAAEKIIPAFRLKNYENVDIRFNNIKNLNFVNGIKYNKDLFFEGNFIK